MKAIEIKVGADGSSSALVDAHVYGAWAAHVRLNSWGGYRWTVTHTPSGMALPCFEDVDTAPVATTINEYDSSISLDLLITISAGRIEALADLVHGREPNESRAFARSTCREMWRPVFGLAYREQLGLSTSTPPAEKGGQ